MQPEVLIAYVTRSGSTEDIAETMGLTMQETGISVDVKPMVDVESIPENAAVILGAALYVGHFPKEFHRFVAEFKSELANAHPWIFVVGPTEQDPKHFASAEEQARKELAKYPWLRAADVRVFGGKFDPNHLNLPFPMNLVMKLPGNPMRKLPVSDIRDWAWIRRWAGAIADHLKREADVAEGIEQCVYPGARD
jgi:menaquinone-dependent protoporphyrinogen oxidase